ncbi:MAG TPA: glycoside hydrolase family 172 protein [Terriglobales bacterium]|nr:glycoside hydrolase family 172 protein [Terriglobales bacterium]
MKNLSVFLILAGTILFPPALAQAQAGPGGQERPLDELFVLRNTKTARISSYDRSGGNLDFVVIAPGETKTLAEIPGAGIIRRFYLAPFALDRMRYRKMLLRIYWDGQKDPCVEVPFGDFFGSGLGTLRYFHSVAMDVNPGFRGWDFDAMVSYLPMPFAHGARITLENDGAVPGLLLWYHIDYEQYPDGGLPPNSGRFHAQWRRVAKTPVKAGSPKNSQLGNLNEPNLTGEDNFVILDAEGHGSYVGLYLIVDNIAGGWYGEGDDMIFVDGAKWPPTYPGTGHEEVFNSGACPDGEFWGMYTGFYLIENMNGSWGGKNQMYRFYVNDPIHFQKSIRVTIEHGHNNNFENDYTATAFWYQQDPHKTFPVMASAKERLPVWPEGVAQAIDKETALRRQIAGPISDGTVHLEAQDNTEWEKLEAARNKEFRALHYQDFIRDVNAMEDILKKYPQSKPQ